MYNPLYKSVALEAAFLAVKANWALIVWLIAGELPSFAKCKKLKQFAIHQNKFTGIVLFMRCMPRYTTDSFLVQKLDVGLDC